MSEYDDFFDDNDNQGEDFDPVRPRRVNADTPLYSLPELKDGQTWSCDMGCNGKCKPVQREVDYSVSHDPKTGETIRQSETVYVASCCTGNLTLWSDATDDADPVEIAPEHFKAPVAAIVEAEPVELWYSVDGEAYTYQHLPDILEHLRDIGRLNVGDVFMSGESFKPDASSFFNVDHIIENAYESAQDDHGEFAESFLSEATDNGDAKKELRDFLDQWADKHFSVTFGTVDNPTVINVTQEMIDSLPPSL